MFGFLLQHAVEWVKVAVEIGLLAVLIYLALQFVRETRAVAILAGIIILALGLSVLSRAFDLEVMGWLVSRMWAVLAFTTVIVFQPDDSYSVVDLLLMSELEVPPTQSKAG